MCGTQGAVVPTIITAVSVAVAALIDTFRRRFEMLSESTARAKIASTFGKTAPTVPRQPTASAFPNHKLCMGR